MILKSGMLRCFSHVQLFATPWTVTCQAPLSMGFSRQEYWSGLSCPPPGDLLHPGTSSALAARFFTTSATWEALESGKQREINLPIQSIGLPS